MKISTVRKALMAAFTAALAATVAAYPDGFTDQELSTILGAAVVAGFAVWKVENEPVQ